MEASGEAAATLAPAPSLLQRRAPIEAWIESLSPRKRAALLQYVQLERSAVNSYLYASMLGLDCVGVDEWEAWVMARCPKLDYRAVLEGEIVNMQKDIVELRLAAHPKDGDKPSIRLGDLPTKISYLNKEIRQHSESLAKDQAIHDRRSLLLAGMSVLVKNLRKVYGRDGSVWPAIEAVVEASWADIEARHKAN